MLGLKLIHVSKRGYRSSKHDMGWMYRINRSLPSTKKCLHAQTLRSRMNENVNIYLPSNVLSSTMFNALTVYFWNVPLYSAKALTHWGQVTHICVGNLSVIGSDNGLSPCRRQAIIWTNAGKLLIGPLGTIFSEIVSAIYTFSLKKMRLKMSSDKWRPCCLGPNMLSNYHCTHRR